jgi:hypothetical protein
VEVSPYKPPEAGVNQFVLFLKPEATAARKGVDLPAILGEVAQTMAEYKINVGGIRVLGGPYLERTDIMSQHYGVISRISREGSNALSEEAKGKLFGEFKEKLGIDKGSKVVGAHQFLSLEPDFTPLSLQALGDNLGPTKLAGGSYAVPVRVRGKLYTVLNSFHPFQLVPFTSNGSAIVVFECTSTTDWADLRQKFCGATNPQQAASGSLRRTLLDKQQQFKLADVSSSANGIHLSAGPLEGMVEIYRFMMNQSGSYFGTAFGKELAADGLSLPDIQQLAANPNFGGKSVFDATEETNAKEAAKKLQEMMKSASA